MIANEQMVAVLEALPDPAFILSSSGKYVAVFGGSDARYYHDGHGLIGAYLHEVIKPAKAAWFLQTIDRALSTRRLLIEEYELSNKDVKGLPDEGPVAPIWFEGRIQALDFRVDGEEVVLWVASNISKRHELELRLRELSDTDQLTGLYNRRRLERDFALHFDNFSEQGMPTTILMLDIDNLKQINDTKGHHKGDENILAVAEICRREFRKTDYAYRFGGDEFVVVLPGLQPTQAMAMVEALHQSFNHALSALAEDELLATISLGMTGIKAGDTSYQDTLRRADMALYQAKDQGKNQLSYIP
ncbi:GGDEF domain-containing protein [Shewanella sp. KCT]|uniref:GGDEF domain-containing protein n=1 Tax=Shewanella sp. KCT TaxID=2569535 RepID=UPI0011824270|nr:sensor domain-containing diguanylate cyclase [Shewanella sp. KCT]TVP15204.1 deoxycytidine triphosphate deaminase [Shewanella sp. KCT]